jgi:fibronectin type 3 domain-containing protein
MLSDRLGLAAILSLFAAAQVFAQNAATTVTVDASTNRHAINPNIYGIAYGDVHDMTTLNAPLNRWGGNATSRYNWQIDAHSAGADWYFETYSDGIGTPAGSADAYVATTRANAGAEPLFTIPMIDYLANLGANRSTLEGFSVKKYGAQQATDPWNSDAGNGVSSATGKDITSNNPLDTGVANSTTVQQGWLQHFVSTFGPATTSTGIKYYVLDNEPSLWYSTHRDVHPNPSTYQEMYDKIVAYASTIKSVDPAAKIIGPEEWGWWAMFASGFDQANGWSAANSDYNTHNQTYYYPWLLQQLYAYKQQTGTQLIDVLSVHCYNGAPSGSDDSLSGQQSRNKETRILWDPTFQDPSWYGDIGINGRVINWIPTLKAMVSQYYPGIEIGCTEYNWGDEPNLNGATTQADVLGIYGREGFDLATRWTVATNTSTTPTTYYVTYLASKIYRNYDGNNSGFGETSVEANVANPDNVSAFASVRESDGALTVMVINKQQGSTPVTLSLANFSTAKTAQAWQINSASQTSINRLTDVNVANNSVSLTVPSQSITLFVIPAGSTLSAPSAPTGLAATVGNGTVTLTWNAAGGATGYTVKRGIASGGPYVTAGTVGSAPTSFADSGVTNGTTYYYVVTGANSAGTSPNSSQLAAIPLAPPTFTSSATAFPNPVTQGVSTSISATVKDTMNTLTNGIVQITILDPNGATALTRSFTEQNFTSGQTHPYSVNLVPSLAGTYTIEIGVSSSTNQSWNWNASAGTITVNSNITFTSSATPTPSTFAPGASTSIAVPVTDTGTGALLNSIVELQVFNQSGIAVMTTYWTGQNFAAGQTLQFSYTWSSSASLPTGTYSVDVGVFNSTWATNYYWNGSAGSITISSVKAPTAPTGLTATAGSTNVSLSWSASSSAGSYNVYRGTAAGGESATPLATNITSTSYADSAATNGTKYYYKVAAVNTGGTSPFSNEASATPKLSAPAAPTGLTATAGSTEVTLAWIGSSGATSYNVYRGSAAGSERATPIATGINTTSFADTGLTNGKTYFFKVTAVNGGGTSAPSNEASAKPQAPTPPAPTAPTGLAATPGSARIKLKWTASAGAKTYNVYRGTAPGAESTTPIATGITRSSYTSTGLTISDTYFFKVAAVNAGGASALSNEASATPKE